MVCMANTLPNPIEEFNDTDEERNSPLESDNFKQELLIVTCDTGPGVPTAAREKIFERFFRLEESRSSSGNGLGLSLVDAIVSLHHGRIELADNRPGLNLTITLPRVF